MNPIPRFLYTLHSSAAKSIIHKFLWINPLYFVILGLLLCCGCERNSYVREQGMVWNTTYHITFRGDESLRDSVLCVLDEVGKSLSVFDRQSLVSRVNNGDTTKVDSHFQAVYLTSKRIHEASDGMFDPTLSPLITAWGFGPGHEMSADTIAVDSILKFVGLAKTRLTDNLLIKDDRRTQFNFSAIAKGYGCDMIARMLRRNGVTDYLIEIGGEVACGGQSPSGGEWKISIDKPIENDSAVVHDACAVITITDVGVATSGNYRNFHKKDGKSLGHTISPVTGRPVATDVVSATVVAPTSMEADAAATACMAVGSQRAATMLRKLGYEAMLVLTDSVWISPGFKKLMSE